MVEGTAVVTAEAIDSQRERLIGELRAIDARVLSECPLDRYVGLLDSYPAMVRLGYVSPAVDRICETIQRHVRQPGLELYHQALLLTLMGRARGQVAAWDLPEEIKLLYEAGFRRILREIEGRTRAAGFYLHPRFCKDLGICTLRFIPAGAQIIHLYRLPLRLFLPGSLRQVLSWLAFVARMKGLRGFYEMHAHSDDLESIRQFNPAGWRQFYHRVADLLRRDPRVKGITGGSWLFDPALDQVSPNLSYVRTMITENGGRVFRLGPCNADGVHDATVYSTHRRRLYEEGTYRPAAYVAVWPRKELIAWAERD